MASHAKNDSALVHGVSYTVGVAPSLRPEAGTVRLVQSVSHARLGKEMTAFGGRDLRRPSAVQVIPVCHVPPGQNGVIGPARAPEV